MNFPSIVVEEVWNNTQKSIFPIKKETTTNLMWFYDYFFVFYLMFFLYLKLSEIQIKKKKLFLLFTHRLFIICFFFLSQNVYFFVQAGSGIATLRGRRGIYEFWFSRMLCMRNMRNIITQASHNSLTLTPPPHHHINQNFYLCQSKLFLTNLYSFLFFFFISLTWPPPPSLSILSLVVIIFIFKFPIMLIL